jgi:hypothetical protein
LFFLFIAIAATISSLQGNKQGWESYIPAIVSIFVLCLITILMVRIIRWHFWIRRHKDTSVSAGLRVAISVSADQRFEIRDTAISDSKNVEREAGDALVPLNRSRVLREILNLDTFRFKSFGVSFQFDPGNAIKKRFTAFFYGVPFADFRCLETVRDLRRESNDRSL